MQRRELEDGGLLVYVEDFLPREEAAALFVRLRDETAWSQQTLHIAGRAIAEPRLTAWYGDPGATYRYSGIVRPPIPWTGLLATIRDRVVAFAEAHVSPAGMFNSVLINHYRDGRDSVGFHADAEPELGRNPVVASLSLGATRRFVLKHKRRKDVASLHFDLPGGSLLVMAGTTQHFFRHGVPKAARPVGPRINLTFRRVVTLRDQQADESGRQGA